MNPLRLVSPLRRQIRSSLVGVLVGLGLAGGLAGCGGRAADSTATSTVPDAVESTTTTAPTTTVATTTTVPTTTVPPTTAAPPPTATPAPVPVPGSATALAGLATLPVKGRAPLTGYSRAQFGPAWTDDVSVADGHNHCDTRDDILRRDLTSIAFRSGSHNCIVARGVLHDPYTNTTISFSRGPGTSSAVQIDHVVALANAWQTGAQQLSMAARTNFANDPLNLRATSGPINQQKGDGDAATWLPPNRAFRCTYVATQVAVKIRYHLWVTPPEHAAIARVLSSCPTQRLPAGVGPPTPVPPTTAPRTTVPPAPVPRTTVPRPTPAPPTTRAPTPAPGGAVVHPGAFCSPPGARGRTSKGTAMVCKIDSTGKRYRWGKA